MGFFGDIWDGIKSAANWTYNAAKDVIPIAEKVLPYVAPLLLKKGGKIEDFKDTPANRKKILTAFNKIHPEFKMTEAKIKKYMAMKKKGGMIMPMKKKGGMLKKK
jgi:hypothetical protein